MNGRFLARHLGLAIAVGLAMVPLFAYADEPVANFVNLGITPSDGAQNQPGRNYTNSPQSLSYSSSANSATVFASPLDLDAQILVSTQYSNEPVSIAGYATTRRWQSLSGTGSTALLYVDFDFAGTFVANLGGNASFVHILSYRRSPTASPMTIMALNGTANSGPDCAGWSYPDTPSGTWPPECYENDGTPHTIDETIQSLAFEVDLGIPFALTLSSNATVSAGGVDGFASVDFYDPMLSSFWIDLDGPGGGGLTPLSEAPGFSLQVIPEPSTLALIGFGLIGLAMIRQRRLATST